MAVFAIAIAVLSPDVCPGGAAPGAEQILLSGGSSGNVPFPHLKHQQAIQDCNVCHGVFAQKAGAIDDMKADNSLKKMQVMNKQCIRCHKEKKSAGVKTGPTTCKSCHVKD